MKPLAVTLGDPAGIGSEIVWKALDPDPGIPLWLFGSRTYADAAPPARRHIQIPTLSLDEALREPLTGTVFVDVGNAADPELRFGVVDRAFGDVALRAISAALTCIRAGVCAGLVTAPIHKQAIVATGSVFHGHTELLASDSNLTRYGAEYAMLFDTPSLRVVLLSVHVPLTEAIRSINGAAVGDACGLIDRECGRLFGKRPRIAVAGLNPHAGEGGLFGGEESSIAEGVAASRAAGLNVEGPFPADTVFHEAAKGRFDVVLAMYHDQGLIPIKTLHFAEAVNVTIGLPYLRASVDHGTAFDIAGRGVADAEPMRYAILWAAEHAERYRQ